MTIVESDSDLKAAEEEGLLTRWSRRKHEAKADPVEEEAVEETLAVAAELDEPEEFEEFEENLPEDSDMPALETLDEDSDYSGFMSPRVSDGLRALALRQLFRGSMFNIRDGLDDYDDDFTQFTKLGDVITAEMRRQMARLKASSEDDPLEDTESEQNYASDNHEGSSPEDASELSIIAEGSDGSDESLDEQIIENEQFTEKEDSGEKLYAGKNR